MNGSAARWSVLVVDDSPEFLSAARAWLATRPEFEVVGTAGDGEEALREIPARNPDLVLMDAAMPVLDGFDATRRLREAGDDRWVILVSFHDSVAVRQAAWAAGADGFVSKSELTGALPGIVRDLAAGRRSDPGDGPRGTREPRRDAPRAPRRTPPPESGAAERVRLDPPGSPTRSPRDLVLEFVRFVAGMSPAARTAQVHGGSPRVPSGFRKWEGCSMFNVFKNKTVWVAAMVAMVAIAPAMARKEFTPIAGSEFLYVADMTDDGSVLLLAGQFGGGALTWTRADGLVLIGQGGCSGQLRMSGDGSMIVGNERDAMGVCQPHRYEGNGQWIPMGSEPGALECGAGSGIGSSYDINNDTAVGLFWTSQLCRAIGGTWDLNAATAGPRLATTVPNRPTRGNGITTDGSVVVGWQDQEDGFRAAVKWVNGVQETILDDAGSLVGEALGVNSDGTVVYGAGWQGGNPAGGGYTGQGWLYRAGSGMIPMGVGAYGRSIQSPALDATDDGSTVIGITRDFDAFIQYGWIWNETKGWQTFDDFMKGWGARGWTNTIPTAISDDGNVIAGWGFNPDGVPQAFVVNLKTTGNPNN